VTGSCQLTCKLRGGPRRPLAGCHLGARRDDGRHTDLLAVLVVLIALVDSGRDGARVVADIAAGVRARLARLELDGSGGNRQNGQSRHKEGREGLRVGSVSCDQAVRL